MPVYFQTLGVVVDDSVPLPPTPGERVHASFDQIYENGNQDEYDADTKPVNTGTCGPGMINAPAPGYNYENSFA